VRTNDPKTNVCPPDRDHDGIPDAEDACPDTPGVRTDDPKTNGCPPPPPDRDGDGIIDSEDACPDIPGPRDPDPAKNGCPLVRIDVKKKQILILQQVKFRFNKAVIDPVSDPILTAVAETLVAHPEFTKVRIEGHTDNVGKAGYNLRLSQQRAAAVVKWLIGHGIEKSRLYSRGFGLTMPLEPNDSEAGRAQNRRVEFHVEHGLD
jgi:outer membrane protein OmpA-like peptidoglycan-associated protein